MMKVTEGLSLLQLSAVQELANIGLGRAATALSDLTGNTFHLSVPTIETTGLEKLPDKYREEEGLFAGVYTPVEGDFEGCLAFLFDWSSITEICQILAGYAPPSPGEIDEMHASVLMEVGNILNSSFLNAFSEMTGLTMTICPPVASIADAPSILASLAAEAEMNGAMALAVDTLLESIGKTHLSGSFFMIPGPDGFSRIFRSLGIEDAA
jgi:chemotaxis protein CheC